MKSISILLIVPLLTLSACLPSTDMIQHGNERIQFTQTYNWFGQNIVERTKCANGQLVNGYCPPDPHPTSAAALNPAPGVEVVKAVLGSAAIVGGAWLLSSGIRHQNVSQPSNNTVYQPFDVSTFNTGVNYVPLK